MIDFRYIEKSKLPEYKSYYSDPEALGCESNLVSAFLWCKEYELKVAVCDNTLVKAYYRYDGSVWGYCMPVGENDRALAEILIDKMRCEGKRPAFEYLSRRERDRLDELFPARFSFSEVADTRDYIYLTENLAALSGKKYQSKRNHISKFHRSFDNCRTVEIDGSNKCDALRVAELWCEENGYDISGFAEYKIIRDALIYMEELGIRGILLYVDEKPVAMTLGNEISPVCFDVMFEKALRSYEGSYAVINNEFAKTLTAYTYLNREEDMGIEGLRKAKLSYHPAVLYERFRAEYRDDV